MKQLTIAHVVNDFENSRKATSCQDQSVYECPSLGGKEAVDHAIKISSHPTMPDLAETFKFHRTTLETEMEALSFTRKLDRWVPRQLTGFPGTKMKNT